MSTHQTLRAWTAREVRQLRDLHDQGMSNEQIAASLQRTTNAIAVRLHQAGVRRHKPWTDEDDTALVQAREQGHLFKLIADDLGRSERACIHRAYLLRGGRA